MPTTELTLPDKVDTEITQLVDRGEFLNREQAIEELLSMGISAYDHSASTSDEGERDLFTQRVDDQRDPAANSGPDDEYPF